MAWYSSSQYLTICCHRDGTRVSRMQCVRHLPLKHPFITDSHAQFNLGWKLALIHKGLAPPTLLTTYTSERLPVTAAMLRETTKLTARAAATRSGAGRRASTTTT